MCVAKDDLPLEGVYRWERERAGDPFLTQPFGGGRVREWTWAEGLGETRRIAAHLQAQQWPPGTRIGILSKNCAWWIFSDLAIWMAGHVSVPVYPSLRAESIRQILEHSGTKACFLGSVDEAAANACTAPGISWIRFPNAKCGSGPGWDELVRANSPINGSPVRPADDLATIIYTSGTTGAHKGVMHRFGSLAFDATILAENLHLDSNERVLSYLPLAHILERCAVEGGACRLGWHLFFTEGVETFLDDLRRAKPTIFLAVPRVLMKLQQGVFAKMPPAKLQQLLRIPGVSLYIKRRIRQQLGMDKVQYAACGGAPLNPDLLMWYRNLGLELLEGYGMTETMITHLPKPGGVRPGYVGPALRGVETKVGSLDELLVRSPMNFTGYYLEPGMTSDAFTEDGFFKTGDVVSIEPDGQVKIVGRLKDQFKTSKGKFVTPAPIEARLMEHPAIESCCLMGSGEPSPLAVVVLTEETRELCSDPDGRLAVEDSLRELLMSVNETLDPFERLSMIVIADGPWTIANGFVTPTLKLRRSLLEGRYQAKLSEWRAQGDRLIWESIPSGTAGLRAPQG